MKRLILIFGLVLWRSAIADAPSLLPYRGRLTDAQGAELINGIRTVQFKLYSQPVGGAPVWAGEVLKTSINGGLVDVLLGTKTPLTGIDLNRQLFLEVTMDVNGDDQISADDPPFFPRQTVLPALFAKEALKARSTQKLNGADWTALLSSGTDPRANDAYLNIHKFQLGSLDSSVIAGATIQSTQIAAGAVTDQNLALNSVGVEALKKEILDQLMPPGVILPYAGATVPQGWLPCDGRVLLKSEYPRLYAAIGISWGAYDFSRSFFQLPDLRGEFLRGVSNGSGMDPEADGRTASGNGGNTGDQVGTLQIDQFASHTHGLSYRGNILGVFVPGSQNPGWDNPPGPYFYSSDTLNLSISPYGGPETRPVNANVNYIIKF